ncbi:uncharacterized protein V2V93DRAFT_316133, partial [Kockiozyma suomiensis]|uniref:uncharacterized protein n=1 Tax=Kockiozyma suomiensis TaxID=1337062 RepID=UPI003344025B
AAHTSSSLGDFAQYLTNKKRKLQDLDLNLKENDSFGAADVSADQLFRGCSIYVNGYTSPSISVLHRLVVLHGGRFCQYMDSKTSITHIVASSLTPKKHIEFNSYRVVRPEWIVESIDAGRLLPWHNFRTVPNSESQLVFDDRRNNSAINIQQRSSSEYVAQQIKELENQPHNNDSASCHIGTSSISRTLDVDFVRQYYSQSRLHHLSTWKAELRKRYQNLILNHVTPKSQTISKMGRRNSNQKQNIRVIFHVDFDCFFASVAVKLNPQFNGKPLCVGNGGTLNSEIASCNYEARKFGVKNGMWMHQAKKLCSNLVCLPYQFEEYERVSSHLYNVLLDCGADRIEAVSIDEALVDLTTACTNDDAIDIQSKALSISQNIRRRIYQLSGCTVSVGIGDNILQSKIATKLAKPDGQYYITAKESLDIIGSMDITDLPGVGYSTGALLKQHLPSINKIRDVRAVSLSSLKQILGEKTGIKIHRSSFGIDDREVGEVSARKSVGVEINWGVRLSTFDEVQKFIRSLATELFQRLQQLNITGKTLTLKVQNRAPDAPIDPPKYLGCGDCISYSRSASFSDESFSINDICNLSLNLILKMPVIVQDIRGIGLQITKLSNA